MKVVVGIDGTGSEVNPGKERDRRYLETFRNSFVSKICRNKPNRKYLLGPVMLGGGLPEAINDGVSFIMQSLRKDPGYVLLTGYSRGALGVTVIANELKKKYINVRALLLFDSVDRHLAFDGSVIPSNVENIMHVIRDPASSSRESFSNDGLRYFPKSTHFEPVRKFMCTHGGMGGMPWEREEGQLLTDYIDEGGYDGRTNITFRQDTFVSGQVWDHCLPFMRQHGFYP